jgi:hypothetical protein
MVRTEELNAELHDFAELHEEKVLTDLNEEEMVLTLTEELNAELHDFAELHEEKVLTDLSEEEMVLTEWHEEDEMVLTELNAEEEMVLMSHVELHNSTREEIWFLDSGYSNHMWE